MLTYFRYANRLSMFLRSCFYDVFRFKIAFIINSLSRTPHLVLYKKTDVILIVSQTMFIFDLIVHKMEQALLDVFEIFLLNPNISIRLIVQQPARNDLRRKWVSKLSTSESIWGGVYIPHKMETQRSLSFFRETNSQTVVCILCMVVHVYFTQQAACDWQGDISLRHYLSV